MIPAFVCLFVCLFNTCSRLMLQPRLSLVPGEQNLISRLGQRLVCSCRNSQPTGNDYQLPCDWLILVLPEVDAGNHLHSFAAIGWLGWPVLVAWVHSPDKLHLLSRLILCDLIFIMLNKLRFSILDS